VVRSDLLGPGAGYEPGGGYRPEGLTLRGIAIAAFAVAAYFAAYGLVEHRYGEPATRDLTWMLLSLCLAWTAARMIRFPERYEQVEGEDHRRRTRWCGLVLAAVAALLAAISLYALLDARS
jgi:uncharacterized membrane protein